MDASAELERIIGELEGKPMPDSTREVLMEILGDSLPTPSSAPLPPPPVVLLNQSFNVPLGAAPHFPEQPIMANCGQYVVAPIMRQQPMYQPSVMQSGVLFSQAGIHSQGQHLPRQWPAYNLPGAAGNVVPQRYNIVPPTMPPLAMGQTLNPGTWNIGMYGSPSLTPTAAQVNTSTHKKRVREDRENGTKPYVKKPLNAFMLFREEQRPNVVAELRITESATVNTILGQRWKLLPDEERAKYYEAAQREKQRHSEQHPEWSAKDNYGKKRKRLRKSLPGVEACASTSNGVTQRAKRRRKTQKAMVKASATQTDAKEFSHTLTSVMEASNTHIDMKETQAIKSESDFCDVLQMLMDIPTTSSCTFEATQCDEELCVAPALETPKIKPEEDFWDLLQLSEMDSPATSTSTSVKVTHPAKRLCVTPERTMANPAPEKDFWAVLQLCQMDCSLQHPKAGASSTVKTV